MLILIALCLLHLSWTSRGTAQTVSLGVGDPLLESLTLRAGPDTLEAMNRMGDQQQSVGFYVNSATPVDIAGRAAYALVSLFYSVGTGSFTYDTLAVDASTFAPIYHRVHAQADSAMAEYRSEGESSFVEGWFAPAGGERTEIDTAIDSRVFDAGTLSWLLRGLPWAEGSTVTVELFDQWTGDIRKVELRVLGEEQVTVGGKCHQTWKVLEDRGPSDVWQGRRSVRIRWIDESSGHMVQGHDGRDGMAPTDGYWLVLKGP
jgi:hypothetical protein